MEITSRLPAETVLECKLVCNECLNTFRVRGFAEKHLEFQLRHFHLFHNYKYYPSSENNAATQYNEDDIETYNEEYYYMAYAECHEIGENNWEITSIKRIKHPVISIVDRSIGLCDGLICLSQNNGVYVYICNPMIRECVLLPGCRYKFVQKICYGFGCTATDRKEYKVVRIIYYQPKQEKPPLVEVYTLGSGLGWRDIGTVVHSFKNNPGVLVDGALHWVDNKGKIWAFCLADEQFNFLTQISSKKGSFDLVVLGGWLSYFEYGTKQTTLWSFKKITREQQSPQWSEVLSVPTRRNCLPFALTNRGGVLYWTDATFLSVYNPKTDTSKKLHIDELVKRGRFEGILHINSFISLKTIGEGGEKYVKRIGK